MNNMNMNMTNNNVNKINTNNKIDISNSINNSNTINESIDNSLTKYIK